MLQGNKKALPVQVHCSIQYTPYIRLIAPWRYLRRLYGRSFTRTQSLFSNPLALDGNDCWKQCQVHGADMNRGGFHRGHSLHNENMGRRASRTGLARYRQARWGYRRRVTGGEAAAGRAVLKTDSRQIKKMGPGGGGPSVIDLGDWRPRLARPNRHLGLEHRIEASPMPQGARLWQLLRPPPPAISALQAPPPCSHVVSTPVPCAGLNEAGAKRLWFYRFFSHPGPAAGAAPHPPSSGPSFFYKTFYRTVVAGTARKRRCRRRAPLCSARTLLAHLVCSHSSTPTSFAISRVQLTGFVCFFLVVACRVVFKFFVQGSRV
jgi:hypothetical protein